MREFISTDKFVSEIDVTNVWQKKIVPTSSQYAIVSAMVNRKHVIVSAVRQSGLTLTACIATKFMEDVQRLNPIILVRNEDAKTELIGFSEKTVKFLPNIGVEGEVDNLEDYDVVIVDDFMWSSNRAMYAELRRRGKVNIILLNSHDKRSTVDTISSLGGHFDVLSMCNDSLRWGLVAKYSQDDENPDDFFNLWTKGNDNA